MARIGWHLEGVDKLRRREMDLANEMVEVACTVAAVAQEAT